MEHQLQGKNALITGGAGEIASTIAKTLAAQGVNIMVADLNVESANVVAKDLAETYGVSSKGYYLDVTNIHGHSSFVKEVEGDFGPIDILVNIAGITSGVMYQEMTEENWDVMMDINIKGPVFLTRDIFFAMKTRKSGRIVNIASLAGERGARFAGPHYSISKAGMLCFTKVLALQAGDSGVTVNSVSPGLIDSSMSRMLGHQINPADLPMNRLGTPQEVADSVLYLVSDLASYVTGQNISVNGGQTMR